MSFQKSGNRLTAHNFLLFLASQTILCFGTFAQSISAAQLLVKYTNSGFAAGFGMVCAPLPGVVLSLFSGSLGDRIRTKDMLISLDIIKGFFTLLLIFCDNASSVFILMLSMSLLDVLYNPSKNKLLTLILNNEDLLNGNSIINGGIGAVSILAPLCVSFQIHEYGIQAAVMADSSLCFLSAILLSGIKVNCQRREKYIKQTMSGVNEGIKYCLKAPRLKNMILTLSVIDFGMLSVNIAFYSLAFDTLKVSIRFWGLLLSMLYGMSLFSMLILIRFKKLIRRHSVLIPYLLMAVISAIWCFYSRTYNRFYLLAGAAAEGLCLSLCNTLLVTNILEITSKDYTARVIGIRDLASNFAKLTGILLSYILMKQLKPAAIFCSSAIVVWLFLIFQAVRPNHLFKQIKDNN